MPRLANKNDCCGCAACYSICEFTAIEIKPDETGFLYPIINTEKCKNCNMCERSCPVISPLKIVNEVDFYPKAFIVQHKNEYVRKQSTSGGAFSAIAEAIILLGGVVFGASMEEGFIVKHTYSETLDNLSKFRNSKYVQSEIGESYKQCKEYLLKDRWVCFSGTPCQIFGLLKYLDKEYDKLITVDLVCLAVPSPKVFKKYLELRRKDIPQIDEIMFRNKDRGYKFPTLVIKGRNGDKKRKYQCGSEADEWLRLFLKGYSIRTSCRHCAFQKNHRSSDFTIWDCNNINKKNRKLDDDRGTSNIIVWNKKALRIFLSCKDNVIFKETNSAVSLNEVIRDSSKKSYCPTYFYQDLDNMSVTSFFHKYVPRTIKVQILHNGRYIAYKLKVYKGLKKIINTLR